MERDACVQSSGEGACASSCVDNIVRSAFVPVIKLDLPFASNLRNRIQSAIRVKQTATLKNSKPEVVIEAIAIHMP